VRSTEGQTVKRTRAIVDTHVGKGLLGRVVDASAIRSTARSDQADKRMRVDVKAPGIIPRNGQRADGDRSQAIDALIRSAAASAN